MKEEIEHIIVFGREFCKKMRVEQRKSHLEK
jgi:hypothetical protein